MKLIIQNNRIAATATNEYTGPDEYIDAPADFDIARMGEYRFVGETLILVPERCSKRQGELALLEAGKLDAVEAAIAAITDPVAKRRAQIEYGADVWERDNPFLQGMWATLGGTPEELDDLFRLAVTL